LPRKDILSKFGITDRADLRVQVVEKGGGVRMVDVHGSGDPVKTLTPTQAIEMSVLSSSVSRYSNSLYRGIIATTNRLDGWTINIRSSNFTNLWP
jgi:hypothetical protein